MVVVGRSIEPSIHGCHSCTLCLPVVSFLDHEDVCGMPRDGPPPPAHTGTRPALCWTSLGIQPSMEPGSRSSCRRRCDGVLKQDNSSTRRRCPGVSHVPVVTPL